jgi:hypothetical protein
MNAAQWQAAAHPIVADCYAVMSEFMEEPALEDFSPELRYRYRAAGRRRDPEALRRVCAGLRAAAYEQKLAREVGQRKGAA